MAKKITKIAANTDRSTVMERPRLNVCAYARVSTSSREQSESYATQIEYYTRLIESNIQWNFMGVYADGGISGTSTAKRDDFNNMIRECEEGNIDMIVTKSVTRFCRNTVDCIRNIRKLRKIGVGIYFEKDYIKKRPYTTYGRFSCNIILYIVFSCCILILDIVPCRLLVA